jgi:hypothetical protein
MAAGDARRAGRSEDPAFVGTVEGNVVRVGMVNVTGDPEIIVVNGSVKFAVSPTVTCCWELESTCACWSWVMTGLAAPASACIPLSIHIISLCVSI